MRWAASDPYSASKAAAEIAVGVLARLLRRDAAAVGHGARRQRHRRRRFRRADRLIPDLVRAALAGQPLLLRRPDATRPFQHVLDVLRGYLMLAERLADGRTAPPALNFGPARRRDPRCAT